MQEFKKNKRVLHVAYKWFAFRGFPLQPPIHIVNVVINLRQRFMNRTFLQVFLKKHVMTERNNDYEDKCSLRVL